MHRSVFYFFCQIKRESWTVLWWDENWSLCCTFCCLCFLSFHLVWLPAFLWLPKGCNWLQIDEYLFDLPVSCKKLQIIWKDVPISDLYCAGEETVEKYIFKLFNELALNHKCVSMKSFILWVWYFVWNFTDTEKSHTDIPYIVTPPLIGCACTQNDPWISFYCRWVNFRPK